VTRAEEFVEILLNAIAKPSERDKQVKLGPSEIGGCYFCVGYTMARRFYDLPEREGEGFGYAAWLGTALHHWMETQLVLPVETLREVKLETVEVAGYGLIRGTCDLIVPDFGLVGDYKFPGKFSYEKYALAKRMGEGLPPNYRYQAQLYAHGARRQGLPVDLCLVVLFPRHTNSIRDVLTFAEPYREEMVELARRRAEAILEDIHDGNLWALPSDEDCYQCDKHGRPDEIQNYTEQKKEQAA
jgi:hypothetical protein